MPEDGVIIRIVIIQSILIAIGAAFVQMEPTDYKMVLVSLFLAVCLFITVFKCGAAND